MNKEQLLTLVTDPVRDDYFPDTFLQECQSLKELDYINPLSVKDASLARYKQVLPDEWHAWFECYIQLCKAGKFPSLWPFRQNMIGFDFEEELDDFDVDDAFFSLGSDPIGDWFVMTQKNGCEVSLCDHHVYDLYDFWINPNHLLAWALRSAMADENGLTKAEVTAFWADREQRLEQVTMERTVSELD